MWYDLTVWACKSHAFHQYFWCYFSIFLETTSIHHTVRPEVTGCGSSSWLSITIGSSSSDSDGGIVFTQLGSFTYITVKIVYFMWVTQLIGYRELSKIWMVNVTFNDISVTFMTAHRCASGLKKKVDLCVGSQRHRHFIGFFKVPVQHQHWAILTVLPQLGPSMAQRDLSSKLKDDPYRVSLDNSQIHCANGVKTLSHFCDTYEHMEALFF